MGFALRIGSRPSRLALTQAETVRKRLAASMPSAEIELAAIRTSGDRMTTASLARIGGKGLFIKELEQALMAGRIDVAVHSIKDLPAASAPGFRIAAVPERADPRDALLTRVSSGVAGGIAGLPRAARLGTSSLRRRFEALRLRPDLEVGPLRGNVDTRRAKLMAGDFDAIILAMAGLERLGRDLGGDVAITPLAEDDFVPAGGQGALAIETLADRPVAGSAELDAAVGALDDATARLEVTAERSFLAAIGATCVSPVGVHARLDMAVLRVRALLFSIDGRRHMDDEIVDDMNDAASPAQRLDRAERAGRRLADKMAAKGALALIGEGELTDDG